MMATTKKIVLASSVVVAIAAVSCSKVITKITEDDPCTRAFVVRNNAAKTRGPAEKEQLLRDADRYDQQCRDRNAANSVTPKRN